MAKNRNRGGAAVEEQDQAEQVSQEAPASTPEVVAGPNFTLAFRRNHPQNRCSYGIAGNPGIVVFDRGLVAGTVPVSGSGTDLGGMPETIEVPFALVPVKADNKTAKAEAQAAKLAEKARKAQEKIEAAQRKAEEKKAKAEAAAKAAQERLAAAQAKAGVKADAPAADADAADGSDAPFGG